MPTVGPAVPAVLAALLVATASAAHAQPRPRPTGRVATETVLQACTTSWAFACHIPDGRGGSYGTAQPRQHCTRYTLRPDGTVAIAGLGEAAAGRYRLDGDNLTVWTTGDDGAVESWTVRRSTLTPVR